MLPSAELLVIFFVSNLTSISSLIILSKRSIACLNMNKEQ